MPFFPVPYLQGPTKPEDRVVVDFTHPLGEEMRGYWPVNRHHLGENIVPGGPGDFTIGASSTYREGSQGTELYCPGTTGQTGWQAATPGELGVNGNVDFTVFGMAEVLTNADAYIFIFGSSAPTYRYDLWYRASTNYWRFQVPPTNTRDYSDANPTGEVVPFAVAHKRTGASSGITTPYIFGGALSNVSEGTGAAATGKLGTVDGVYTTAVNLYNVGVAASYWTAEHYRMFLDNPYCFLRPDPERWYYYPGAGGHTSTGALTLSAAVIAATGAHPFTGSGALSLAKATLAASGAQPHTATAALALQKATLAATGNQTSDAETGTGALTLPSTILVGQGALQPEAAAALTLAKAILAAQGVQDPEATAALQLAAAALYAEGTLPNANIMRQIGIYLGVRIGL